MKISASLKGRRLRVATRGSELALFQTRDLIAKLKDIGITADANIITTRGDVDYRPFGDISGDGFFTKELERSLLHLTSDIAVHSAKDLPSMIHRSLPWKAVGERASTADVLIVKKAVLLQSSPTIKLRPGARIGTSSPRRIAQIKLYLSGVACVHLRGNVPTRVKKASSAELDGVILAKAGLDRLNLISQIEKDPTMACVELPWVTAPCQGIIGVQVNWQHEALLEKLASHSLTEVAQLEKTVLALLGGGCHLAVGCQVTHHPASADQNEHFHMNLFFEKNGKIFDFKARAKSGAELLRRALNYLVGATESARRVWVTTPFQHALKPTRILSEAGFTPQLWPVTEIIPIWTLTDFDFLNENYQSFQAIAFGSSFAAQIFLKEWMMSPEQERWLKLIPIYAVGAATAEPLREARLNVQELSEKATAESLSAILARQARSPSNHGLIKGGYKVLIPGTRKSQLAYHLKTEGVDFQILELYANEISQHPLAVALPEIRKGDVVVFTSPTAVDEFARLQATEPELKKLKLVSFGPTTSRALRAHGLPFTENPVSGSWTQITQYLTEAFPPARTVKIPPSFG